MNPGPDLDRYSTMLAEAEHVHGVSLARDAWRRLRRNRVALNSLVFLAALSLLAFLTPLLPLQSPYIPHIEAIFSPPDWSPLFVQTLETDAPADGEISKSDKSAKSETTADW